MGINSSVGLVGFSAVLGEIEMVWMAKVHCYHCQGSESSVFRGALKSQRIPITESPRGKFDDFSNVYVQEHVCAQRIELWKTRLLLQIGNLNEACEVSSGLCQFLI